MPEAVLALRRHRTAAAVGARQPAEPPADDAADRTPATTPRRPRSSRWPGHPARAGRSRRGRQDPGHRGPHRRRRGAAGGGRPAVGGRRHHRGERAWRARTCTSRSCRACPPRRAVPTYAGLPLGSSHTVADVRGDVDWAALAAAPGPLILQATASHLADAARTLIEYGLADTTPCVVTAHGTTCQQRSVETTLAGLTDKAALGAQRARGPADRAAGRDDRQDGGQPREAELVGEPRAVRLDRAGAAHQGPGRRDERAAGRRTARCPSRCRPSPSSRRAARRRWSAPSRAWSTAGYQWVVFTSTNAVRAVWEKFNEFGLDARAFSGVKIACVGQATADRVRAFGISPELVPSGEQSSLGPARRIPALRRRFRPGEPGAAAARRHRHRDAGRGSARAWLGDRGRHRLPHGACRSAAGAAPAR